MISPKLRTANAASGPAEIRVRPARTPIAIETPAHSRKAIVSCTGSGLARPLRCRQRFRLHPLWAACLAAGCVHGAGLFRRQPDEHRLAAFLKSAVGVAPCFGFLSHIRMIPISACASNRLTYRYRYAILSTIRSRGSLLFDNQVGAGALSTPQLRDVSRIGATR
jgi:hypothetical protein